MDTAQAFTRAMRADRERDALRWFAEPTPGAVFDGVMYHQTFRFPPGFEVDG